MLIERVQDDLALRVLLDVDGDAHPRAVGFVPDIRDSLDLLVLHHVGDGLDEVRLVDLIRQFGHDDALARAVGKLLDIALRAEDDPAPARAVGLADCRPAHDDAPRWIVGRGDILQKIVHLEIGIVQQSDASVDDLAQIVRGDIGRHADGDPVRAVDQDIREAGGQDDRLHLGIVEVGIKIHRVLVDFTQHLRRQLGKARLRVAVCRRGVAVHRTEVAVPVHERKVDGKILRQAHERVVNGSVAVRVIFTEHFTDDLGALLIALVAVKPHLVHRVEDPSVNGFQPVPDVRDRARNVDRHRVGDKGLLQLVIHLDVDDGRLIQRIFERRRKFGAHFFFRHFSSPSLHVQIRDQFRVLLDERAPELRLFAH